ncbi:MAG: ABC transporter ATP-binding protein [Acidobacteriota bacterium]
MATVSLVGVTKKYGKLTAVDKLSLEIGPTEFFVILGPAGAGKTSTLKMIAGIEELTAGEILIDGARVNAQSAAGNDVAMIFENYALYPHRTVFENIAFPLRSKLRKTSPAEITDRVEAVARVLEIEGLLQRHPAELSGGQKQRVSLGRALVRKPKVFLMDEPLSHLDAKLRHQMRRELKKLKAKLETSVIFVTHDYMEALSLADRIAVINQGRLYQVGTPDEVYLSPENVFVASQFGYPRINLVEGRVLGQENRLVFSSEDGALVLPVPSKLTGRLESKGREGITAGIRPTSMKVVRDPSAGAARVTSLMTEHSGNKHLQFAEVGSTSLSITAEKAGLLETGNGLFVSIEPEEVLYFDRSGQRIKEG